MTTDPGFAPQDPAARPAAPGDDEVVAIAQRFAAMAVQVFHRMPLYRRLCEGAATDLDVAARLLLARSDQRVPNLLLAAVHDLLLAGEPEVLADWYPSIPGQRGGEGHRARPVGTGDDDPWPHFRHLAMDHPGIAQRLHERIVQTNEIGRAAALLPALFQAAALTPDLPAHGVRPIGMIDLGASAGLNLRIDGYGYRYRLAPSQADVGELAGTVESIGARSRLVLEAQLRGRRVPPLPEVPIGPVWARGIDRHPLEVSEPDHARWLVACQWPEELDRLDQLRAAIALAQDDPPRIDQGDAVHDVAAAVLRVPPEALPVVTATWALAYLPVAAQRALLANLDEVSSQRDLSMVFAEQPERVPGLPLPPRPDGEPDGRATALVLVRWRNGERREVRLADMHPHGRWIEWLHQPPG